MMSALKKGSQASKACDLLKQLQKQSIRLGVQSYNIVIAAFADEARWQKALQLSRVLGQNDEALDDFARTKLLTMERMPWRLGLTLVGDGGAEAFRSALQMVGAAAQWSLALESFAQNLHSRRLEPSLGQLATLRWRTSVEELQKVPVVPGPRDLLALLRSAAQQSAPAAALATLPRRAGDGTAAYGAVLGRCAEEKNWTLGLTLLEMMRVENVQNDCLCFSSMMDATSARVDWLKALAIFEGFQKEPLKGSLEDMDLLGSVTIQSCSFHWPCSLQLLRSLRRLTLRPQLLSYTSLTTLLGDDWRQALEVLQHAQEQRVTPNNSLLSSVAATLRVGTWRVTTELLRMANTQQVEIYTSCFNACIGVCAATAWPQALRQLQTLASRFLPLDRLSYRSLQRGPWLVALLATSQPDIAAMNGAASAALVAGKWHRCLEVLLEAVQRSALQFDTVSNYLLMHAQSRNIGPGPGRGQWQISMSVLANAENRNLSDLYRAGIALSLS